MKSCFNTSHGCGLSRMVRFMLLTAHLHHQGQGGCRATAKTRTGTQRNTVVDNGGGQRSGLDKPAVPHVWALNFWRARRLSPKCSSLVIQAQDSLESLPSFYLQKAGNPHGGFETLVWSLRDGGQACVSWDMWSAYSSVSVGGMCACCRSGKLGWPTHRNQLTLGIELICWSIATVI